MQSEVFLNQDLDVNIENIFSGPFDLLLHLVKKHELDLREINLSVLTAKYLETIKTLQSFNIDIASDFLLIASILINLKSRSVLPSGENVSDEDGDLLTPEDLALRLMRFRKFSLAADWIGENIKMQKAVWRRMSKIKEEFISDELASPDLLTFAKTARNLENRNKNRRLHGFYKPLNIPIKRKMTEIIHVMEEYKQLTLSGLFNKTIIENAGILDYVVSFIAVLELAKLNVLTINQHLNGGDVYLSVITKEN